MIGRRGLGKRGTAWGGAGEERDRCIEGKCCGKGDEHKMIGSEKGENVKKVSYAGD